MQLSIPVIPRIEDMPYKTSPPIEFVYRSSAAFVAGFYTWADQPTALVPDRPLMENVLYYFRSITFSADIEELDFTSCIVTMPQFQMYLKSNAKAILFREPVYMVKFLQNFEYRFAWLTQRSGDQLRASFNGVLNQNANLVGKTPITLTAVISAQEIVDDKFIARFKKAYLS
jgi:hypothetical protein